MAAGTTHGISFRLPVRRRDVRESGRDVAFQTWRASILTTAAIGTATLVTTALNVVPGTPVDEIVMATAFTLTGVLGHLAPLSE